MTSPIWPSLGSLGPYGADSPVYPVPTAAVATYVANVVAGVEYLHGLYAGVLDYELAKTSFLNYDGIECFDEVAIRIATSHPTTAVKSLELRDEVWTFDPTYYNHDPMSFIYGVPGHLCYNRGMYRMGEYGDPIGYRCALSASYWGAGSRTRAVPLVLNPLSNAGAREFALSAVLAHYRTWDLEVPAEWVAEVQPELRDDYVEWTVGILLTHYVQNWHDSVYDPWWMVVDPERAAQGLEPWDWAPFMFAHTARALIAAHDNGMAETLGIKTAIETALIQLAEDCWNVAWLEGVVIGEVTYQGFFYRPLLAHNETPSVDLNMFIFPWYAWIANLTGEQVWYERAEKILIGSHDYNIQGLKQFNQNTIDAFAALDRLGWWAA